MEQYGTSLIETKTYAWKQGFYIEITMLVADNDVFSTVSIFKLTYNIKVALVKTRGYDFCEIVSKVYEELLQTEEAIKIYHEAIQHAYLTNKKKNAI